MEGKISRNKSLLYGFRSRTLAMLLVLIMVIGLFGCGSSDNVIMSDQAKHVILIIGYGMQL
jgi:hypothetical protein